MTATRLVSAFNFPPYNDASAVTMAKRIVTLGEEVDVVSMNLDGYRDRDASLYDLVRPYLGVHDLVDGRVQFGDWRSITEFAHKGRNILRRRARRYTSVYSRSMWPHSHFLAALLKADNPDLRWIAEFSDPPLWAVDGRPRASTGVGTDDISRRILSRQTAANQRVLRDHDSVLEWTQYVPCLNADEIIFTNDQQRRLMVSDLPAQWREDVLGRSVISPHPTLPASHYGSSTRTPDASFRVGYFGTFYPNRGAGEFLEAWSSLTPPEIGRIRLDVFSNDTTLLRRAAGHLGLAPYLTTRRPLPLLEFLRRTARYDALLVNDTSTSPFDVASPFLPSKIADYLGSTTPVMALILPGSPLSAIPVAWQASLGDLGSIRSMLREAVGAHPHPS